MSLYYFYPIFYIFFLLFSLNHAFSKTWGGFEKSCVPIHFKVPLTVGHYLQRGNERFNEERGDWEFRADELCTTQGKIKEVKKWGNLNKNFLLTEEQQTRAVLSRDHLNSIGLCFSPVKSRNRPSAKKSGMRNIIGKQIGLKLKAQDSCNVLYVMWRFSPQNAIVISRKLNNSRHTHKECQNGGYKTLGVIPMDDKSQTEFHSIKAKIMDDNLIVYVDEKEMWQEPLEKDLQVLHGPMGMRSDNGTFIFQMDDWKNTQKNCPISVDDGKNGSENNNDISNES